jgi:hypothetical protein
MQAPSNSHMSKYEYYCGTVVQTIDLLICDSNRLNMSAFTTASTSIDVHSHERCPSNRGGGVHKQFARGGRIAIKRSQPREVVVISYHRTTSTCSFSNKDKANQDFTTSTSTF